MNVLEAISKQQMAVYENNQINKKNKKKVKAASFIGATVGIAAAVGTVYSLAKKGNPCVNLKNLSYDEKDVLLIGTGAVLGGLTGGLVADPNKKNKVPKIREAIQQFGNNLFPVAVLAVNNKILEKSGFKLPKINSASKGAKIANNILAVLPKVCVTIGSLIGGMELGNKILNKFNNKVFKEDVKHEVHPEDYLVHTDDLCVAISMLFKDVKPVASVTSKILPFTFLVQGAKSGIAVKEDI